MKSPNEMKMVSHVARDLLHSGLPLSDRSLSRLGVRSQFTAWYVDEGVTPKVQVSVDSRKKEIRIVDNGKGMTATDLRRFFTMHGENLDRKRGRPGRGKFGTGKSAAFGIANILIVDTVHDNKRNVVTLDRQLVQMSDGQSIDLEWQVKDERVDSANGTNIIIQQIVLPSLKTAPMIEYIERHLQTFRARTPQVAVNDHVCTYREPSVAETHEFKPTAAQQQLLGAITLTIKVSPSPLPEPEQGISITAGLGNLVAIETGGIEKKEMGNYLFGEIDVPALETVDNPLEAYDPSRSLKLNFNHPVSMALLQFIAPKLDEVRRIQVAKLREIKRSENAKRLNKLAETIATLLNDDFREVALRLQAIRSASRSGPLGSRFGATAPGGQEEDGFVEGLERPGDVDRPDRDRPEPKPGPEPKPNPKPAPNLEKAGTPNADGSTSVDASGGAGRRKNPRGGFSVDYRNLGAESDRSKIPIRLASQS